MVNRDWAWMSRYVMVIAVALILGAGIGELALFKQTTLGTPKLTASGFVHLIGFGGALLLLWLLGQKASLRFREDGGKAEFLSFIIVPLVTLIVVTGAYSVLLSILRPFLDASTRNLYNWIFVLCIVGSAVWLAIALFHHSEPLVDLFRRRRLDLTDADAHKCRFCGALIAPGANYCHVCGTPQT